MYKLVWTIKAGLCVVLVAAMVHTVLVWQSKKQGFGSVSSAIGVEEPVYPDSPDISSQPTTYDALAQSDMFGSPVPVSVPTPAPKPTPRVPSRPMPSGPVRPIEERLGYSVIGTITGSRAIARATFTDPTEKSHLVCAIDDQIGTATVLEIYGDGVLLDFEGAQQRLDVKKKIPSSLPAPLSDPAPTHIPPRKVTEVKRVNNPMRERIAQIEAFLGTVSLAHFEVNGRIEGIQIKNVDKLPEAQRFGLKNDDVIRYVNGQHLSSKQKAFQVFKKARSQSFIDIELERKGRSKQLSFRIR
jgi:type II secretory pathway component PulC